jgi:hypothetical protein
MDQIQAIASAINGYFDLMYDADDNKYRDVFHDACLIHGLRDGALTAWSAAQTSHRRDMAGDREGLPRGAGFSGGVIACLF